MSDTNIRYYIAGLVDASGKISIVKVKNSPNSVYIKVIIRSSNEEPLKLIKDMYGGSIKSRKKVSHITLTHSKAKNFLEDIKNYLIAKKQEAEIVLRLYESRFTRKYETERKKRIIKEFLKLNSEKPRNIKNGKSSLYKWLYE